ncbi:AbrB/MazE/SpoVT family DNA-binding domain-containing protein [Candidatus Woesearchaeota archaeon]|nr:AbrB/MazE/SpoVT family DNA-binding domain-containing protein [Candidatus Woesearchaeota archaeon]
MRKCAECRGVMQELKAKTPEDVWYSYYKCGKCGEEIVDMKQLHHVAEKYRTLKKYNVKLSKWGLSLGLRIPKELVKRYGLKDEEEVAIIPEEKGIRIVAA